MTAPIAFSIALDVHRARSKVNRPSPIITDVVESRVGITEVELQLETPVDGPGPMDDPVLLAISFRRPDTGESVALRLKVGDMLESIVDRYLLESGVDPLV